MSAITSSVQESSPSISTRERVLTIAQRQGGLVVLVILVVVASIFSPGFATVANIQSILVGNAYVWLLALGMTFVIISGGIDLSVGSLFALGGVLAAWGSTVGGLWLAMILPIVVCGVFGLVQGVFIARLRLAPFIVTLAGLLGARGLEQFVSNEGSATYVVPAGSPFLALGDGVWVPILTVAVFFALAWVLLQFTSFGRRVFAIGGNENASLLMGVPVVRTKITLYLMSGLLAGIAGMLTASRLQSGVTNIGLGYELVAITAVVIGGTLLTGGSGSVLGTVAGVLLLAVVNNLIGVYLSQYGSAASDAVNGAVLAIVVLLQTFLSRARRRA